MADLFGQPIDQRYKIIEPLGEGGMAMVYRAEDTRESRMVALKIIHKEKFIKEQQEEILKRFEQEARALANLSHPNIVPILDWGKHEGSPYLVLEYLAGGTLQTKMNPLLPWQVAIHVMLPIMDALIYCHEHSILHRDIKPSNILFREDNTPVLADFGIAKLMETAGTSPKTGTGVFVGTSGYMAPEQLNNSNHKKLDVRTDVYQLGIVLYEGITGYRPSDLVSIADKIPHPKTYAPNLPGVFNKIILKALALNPRDRYQTMAEFKTALQNAWEKQPRSSNITTNIPYPQNVKIYKRSDDKPSRPLRVFLCSVKSDEANVTSLGDALRQDGIRIRPDKKNSNPDATWQEKIARDVQRSDAMVIYLTRKSITWNGKLQPEIKYALEKAHENSILIVLACLQPGKIPQELSTIQSVDLFEEGAYLKLRSILATRAKQINATSPSTGAPYTAPKFVEKNRPAVIYALLAIILLFIIAIPILYLPQFQPGLGPIFFAQDATNTSTATATENNSSAVPTDIPGVSSLSQKITDRTGADMVLVIPKEFTMGYSAEKALSECKKHNPDCSLRQFTVAEPAGRVFLAPFYIDKYEVTNKAYQECVAANVCQPPNNTSSFTRPQYYGLTKYAVYPVIHVDWNMAKTFCEEWREARLPTEAEWEMAARGENGYLFPWGNNFSGVRSNFCDRNCRLVDLANLSVVDGYSDTAPVTALVNGASEYGIFNMAGNVWEWIGSLYKEYPYDPNDGREDLQASGIRVVRGGSWRDDVSKLFSIARNGFLASNENDSTGFRCAKAPDR